MKRFLGILAAAAAVALAVGYVVRLTERRTSSSVASLLPRETVGFAHLPDFNKTINEWHRSDIYQIYREPSVQEFLKKPMSRSPKTGAASARIHQIQELDARNGFVALTSVANDKPKFVAGFNFHCSQSVADKVIADWQGRMNPSAKRERLTYQKHDIDVFSQSAFSIAMARDQSWFFASNDADELKAVLDRADGRIKEREELLTGDQCYQNAMAAVAGPYNLLLYFQPKALLERLAASRKSSGGGAFPQYASLGQIHSICSTTRFENGKLHDVVFTGMPKQNENGALTRSGLALTTPGTIFYAASLINFSRQVSELFPTGDNNPLGPAVEKIADALEAAGIAPADWDAAFAPELSMSSDWAEQARLPSLLISAGVKDSTRARMIIDTLIKSATEGNAWAEMDRGRVHYWSMTSGSGWFALRPVMALSDHLWITGLDSNSVEAAIQRSEKPEPGLAEAENYRNAIRLVPTPEKFFTYVDPALIYSRLDATVRPFLMMGAAFIPGANDTADFSKLPPPEAITKHLSPIVSSQYYSGKGYISESVGPVTLNQGGLGIAVLGGFGAMTYQRLMPHAPNQSGVSVPGYSGSSGGSPAPRATGTATPMSSPQQTP